MNHLVIGLGEVGRAIQKALSCDGIDQQEKAKHPSYDILDICFGYTPNFVEEVNKYREKFQPRHIVIHSTVPMGTSESLNAHHSPVCGRHPNLYESVMKFEKFLAGPFAHILKMDYENYGLKITVHHDSRSTERLKLWQTTAFAVQAMLEKEIYEDCKENNLSFDLVYTKSFGAYNAGYELLGQGHFKLPILKHIEGKLGGHCVIPNCHLLNTKTAKRILEENEKL